MMGDFFVNSSGAPIPVLAYQLVSLVLFFAGIYGFITRKNIMMMLISVELILNAADINFAVFNRYLYPDQMDGMFFALFTIGVAACETAVAIAIIINVYRNFGNADVDNIKKMKG